MDIRYLITDTIIALVSAEYINWGKKEKNYCVGSYN